MLIGKIIGSVVSTRKNEKLVGSKFMIVETLDKMGDTKRIVAVDNVGAGIGEMVLVALGSAARIGCDQEKAPIDAMTDANVEEIKAAKEKLMQSAQTLFSKLYEQAQAGAGAGAGAASDAYQADDVVDGDYTEV